MPWCTIGDISYTFCTRTKGSTNGQKGQYKDKSAHIRTKRTKVQDPNPNPNPLDQNAPHDFLYIPQLWEICSASLKLTAELQIFP